MVIGTFIDIKCASIKLIYRGLSSQILSNEESFAFGLLKVIFLY